MALRAMTISRSVSTDYQPAHFANRIVIIIYTVSADRRYGYPALDEIAGTLAHDSFPNPAFFTHQDFS
ncbi:MAG: hypothetical protein IPL59_19100 [Candidatus Competibacteraceae bacterium]|nr:hypothetical protein [Candidatus Competibacteraceae bacterium]